MVYLILFAGMLLDNLQIQIPMVPYLMEKVAKMMIFVPMAAKLPLVIVTELQIPLLRRMHNLGAQVARRMVQQSTQAPQEQTTLIIILWIMWMIIVCNAFLRNKLQES